MSSPQIGNIGVGVPATKTISAAIGDLGASSRQIAALQGLPAEAAPLQSAAVGLVGGITGSLNSTYQQVQKFVQLSVPLLNTALAALASPDPGQAKQPITQLQSDWASYSGLTATTQDLSAARDKADSLVAHDIPLVQTTLDGRVADLQSQLRDAQTELAQDQSEEEEVQVGSALLNPFGGPTVDIDADELDMEYIQPRIDDMNDKISSLGEQTTQLQHMKASVDGLGVDFGVLADKLEFMKVRVDFIGDDVKGLADNLNDAAKLESARLWLLSVKTKLDELAAI
jgi:hypothetical protein